MTQVQNTDVDVSDLGVVDPAGHAVPLRSLPGVQLLVLMRHRH